MVHRVSLLGVGCLAGAAILVAVTPAEAAPCYISERNYYADASCTGGFVGTYQWGCAGNLLNAWGVQTDHFEWYINYDVCSGVGGCYGSGEDSGLWGCG